MCAADSKPNNNASVAAAARPSPPNPTKWSPPPLSRARACVRVCVTVQGETEGGNGGRGGGLPLLSIFLCLARLLPVPDTGIDRELALCTVVKQSDDIWRSCTVCARVSTDI